MSSAEKKKAPKDKSEKSDSKSSGAKKSTKKEKGGYDQDGGKSNKNIDILDDAAMVNAYNICHNVQDLLYFRGFFWEGSGGKGKKVNYFSCQIVSKITFMLDKF